ncbi:MAG: hemin uptake protein HemP [Gammaproteobacteria bacterium]|nr:hemin uptake protein HemP [Gammaproteobacteria bacterium]
MGESKGHPSRSDEKDSKSSPPRSIESGELLGGANQVFIRHGGQIYTLRRTRENKLILTK